jgi:hypothetical protein
LEQGGCAADFFCAPRTSANHKAESVTPDLFPIICAILREQTVANIFSSVRELQRRYSMRALMLTAAAALVMSVQIAAVAKAEDTTIIKKDNDAGTTTVIKKNDEDNAVIRAPTAEDKKVIIHKDNDD